MNPKPYRIGRRDPDPTWLLKEPPSWRVVFRHQDLRALHQYCVDHNIDPATVEVVANWPWRSLAEHVTDLLGSHPSGNETGSHPCLMGSPDGTAARQQRGEAASSPTANCPLPPANCP